METSDGWSAIRPPAGSHNWIPSNVAYLLPGGKSAEIIEDETPAWVGSDSANVSDFMWQMQLVKSQQVQVLGEELQMAENGKKQLWYRIAPPQGEFRWVKTSQLSDAIKSSSNDSRVQLANYTEDTRPLASGSKTTDPSGEVVWSDEQLALSQVQKEIQREQAEIQSKMAADGVKVKLNSPKLEVRPGSKPMKLVSNSTPEVQDEAFEDTFEQPVASEGPTVITSRIRPIPARPNTKRNVASATHQIDGQRQWEAMQSTNPKPKVRPVSNLLGLIGFSVIEAERAPVQTQIAQQYHATQSQGNIGKIGPVGNSRIDRMPRPGQNKSTMHQPSGMPMSLGDSIGTYEDSIVSERMHSAANSPAMPVPSGPPMRQGETTFSRWLNSREPIFGATQNALNTNLSMNMGSGTQFQSQASAINNQYAGQPQTVYPTQPTVQQPTSQSQPGPIPMETTAWHGLSPSMRESTNRSPAAAMYSNSSSEGDDLDEFQTPEIQSALMHLTREVAEPTENWNFSELKSQAAAWVENGSTAMVRGEARLLIERIERFESLRLRTLGFAQEASMMARQSVDNAMTSAVRQASSMAQAPMAQAPMANSPNNGNIVSNAFATSPTSEGDASGWLVQVHTSIKGQPEFALTDDAGKVITYAQSTPSLNLRRYLQQPVTVYGVRGYIPNLAAKQILVERIVRMR